VDATSIAAAFDSFRHKGKKSFVQIYGQTNQQLLPKLISWNTSFLHLRNFPKKASAPKKFHKSFQIPKFNPTQKSVKLF